MKWYVYHHMFEDKVFYVGKGSGDRAWNKYFRTKSWKNFIKDKDIEILDIHRYKPLLNRVYPRLTSEQELEVYGKELSSRQRVYYVCIAKGYEPPHYAHP